MKKAWRDITSARERGAAAAETIRRAYKAREKAEAEAAAMRELVRVLALCYRDKAHEENVDVWPIVDLVLESDAGREFLERLSRLENERDHLEQEVEALKVRLLE